MADADLFEAGADEVDGWRIKTTDTAEEPADEADSWHVETTDEAEEPADEVDGWHAPRTVPFCSLVTQQWAGIAASVCEWRT